MRVLYDASALLGEMGGVAIYLDRLISAMVATKPQVKAGLFVARHPWVDITMACPQFLYQLQ